MYPTANTESINNLIEKRKQIYLQDPRYIVEHYNNENKNKDEYNGRQLLEMIQNANDECGTTTKPKKVLIKLSNDSLIIANNGNPFTVGGVESLMYSDLSPKVNEQNKIGQKGLGFRSILSWSEEIYIASYDLHLRFSKDIAHRFLNDLINTNPQIQEIINQKSKQEDAPISILRCPKIERNINSKKEQKYDTVIELKLKEGIRSEILTQIEKDIIPEILIFLNNLEEVEVQTSNQHFYYKKTKEHDSIQVSLIDLKDNNKNNSWAWRIAEEKGILSGLKEQKNYELKIAYQVNTPPRIQQLFSYFRTEIKFPYPVIAHGSFELSSNRNHLIQDENKFNKQLLQKLATLLLNTALELTTNTTCTYNALKLVLPNNNNTSLNESPWAFSSLVKKQIETASIFPTITNHYIKLSDTARYYTQKIEHLIPINQQDNFRTLLKHTDNSIIRNYLISSNINLKYSDSELTEKINKILEEETIPIYNRVEWIYLLCNYKNIFYINQNPLLPSLILNGDNQQINPNDEIILSPDGEVYKLPEKIKIQFIQKELFNRLKSKFGNISARQLVEKIKPYSVTEYALNTVIQKIVSASHNLSESNPNKKLEVIKEMHLALYSIYKNIPEHLDSKRAYPSTLTSPLIISRKNKLYPANEMYFGNEYPNGQLVEVLFNGQTRDFFIGSSKDILGLAIDQENELIIINYFEWLGVHKLPKKETKQNSVNSLSSNGYLSSIFENIRYPYPVPYYSEIISSLDEMKQSSSFLYRVNWYEDFEKILLKANIESLLTWFILDRDIWESITKNKELQSNSITFWPPNKRQSRSLTSNDVSSFILYTLKSTNFIPVENGNKVKPNECLLDSSNLSPLVSTSKINMDALIFKENNIDKDQVSYLLKRIGVKDNLKEISIPNLYQYLLKHHEDYKTQPNKAKRFYTALLEATSRKEVIDNSLRDEFFNNGKILALKDGEEQFVPVKDATYVDNPNFSQDLLKKLVIAKLPPRKGNKRIQDLFGVKPLDYIDFNVKENINLNTKINTEFSEDFTLLKPFIYIYRHVKGLSKQQLQTELFSLKKLNIKVCYEVEVDYHLNGNTLLLELNEYEYILDKESKIYHIKVPESIQNYQRLKSDFRFKETVADIICAALKVVENRKDFMLLLGESSNQWSKILNREFNNFTNIEKEVREVFNGHLTSDQQFWQTILDIKNIEYETHDLQTEKSIFNKLEIPIPEDLFFDLYRKIDYIRITNKSNITFFIKIFHALNLDIKDLNKTNKFNLDYSSVWHNKMKYYHKKFTSKYTTFLYQQGVKFGFISLKEEMEEFDDFNIPNSFFLQVDVQHKKSIIHFIPGIKYDGIINTKTIDLDQIYKQNLQSLILELKKEEAFNQDLLNSLIRDLSAQESIYFNEVDELKLTLIQHFKSQKKETPSITIGNQKVDFTNKEFSQVISTIEDDVKNNYFELNDYTPSSNSFPSTPYYKRKNRTHGNNFIGNRNYSTEDIGFIGEKYAFELLKEKYKNVIWASENAIKVGFPKGKAGLGYDFECRNEAETRYIEVKCTTGSDKSFHISKNEVDFANEHSDIFDILLITNILSNNKNFIYLNSFFQYAPGETFFNNSSFSVQNDSFKIRFK